MEEYKERPDFEQTPGAPQANPSNEPPPREMPAGEEMPMSGEPSPAPGPVPPSEPVTPAAGEVASGPAAGPTPDELRAEEEGMGFTASEAPRLEGTAPPQSGRALPPGGEPVVSPLAMAGPTADDRTIAALAHASILLNLVTGFGGLIAAALIWLVYRDRSKYVEDQALQATLFQALWLVSGVLIGVMWAAVGLLSAIIIGICLIPFALLLSLLPVVGFFYPFYAALETYRGRDFKYLWIGDLVRGTRV